MASNDYETLSYRLKFKRAFKIALIILLICIVVLAPAFWIWDNSIQKRQILREAKNVVLGLNFLGTEYYGLGKSVADKGRLNGLSAEAEKEIRNVSGAEGEMNLISWNAKEGCVTRLNYQKGKFLAEYCYDADSDTFVWNIYWRIQQYDE